MNKPHFLVAPSLLSADFSDLKSEVQKLEAAGADWIHVDVMDGHFVPNLTIGPLVVRAIKPHAKKLMDVHLMISEPEKYVEEFSSAGADSITFHVEAHDQPAVLIQKIRQLGCRVGMSLRPGTPVESLWPFLADLDLVLVMTVEPGFGGQSFMRDQVEKVKKLSSKIESENLDCLIEVDGGVTDETAKLVPEADVLVAGSFVFRNSMTEAISKLKSIDRLSLID